MYTIRVHNVNEALPVGLALLRDVGQRVAPRGMATLEYPGPVATVYLDPTHRVLLDPHRDANPFFHFFEALWILAGRQDVEFLAHFNKRIADYSDDGERFHAPYGHRLRHAYGFDQIDAVVRELHSNPDSRRAVLNIWHPALDLNKDSKDIPCNDTIFLKVRRRRLNMTVFCRSNDIVWGCYGANAVQFSMLQEYIAAKLDVQVGHYTQVSDSYHVYEDLPFWKDWLARNRAGVYSDDPYMSMGTYALFRQIKHFDHDLQVFFDRWDQGADPADSSYFASKAFQYVVCPMLRAWNAHKVQRNIDLALYSMDQCISEDWAVAGKKWLLRRKEARRADA